MKMNMKIDAAEQPNNQGLSLQPIHGQTTNVFNPLEVRFFQTTSRTYLPQLFDERLELYIHEGLRDGLFGRSRARVYYVLLGMLRRFLYVCGLQNIRVAEVDGEVLVYFRQFIKNEYMLVDQYPQLYADMRRQNIPTRPRSINTISTRMRMLFAFFRELQDREEISKSPFLKMGKARKVSIMRVKFDDPIFLYAEELQIIMHADVPPSLEETRQAFVLQCALGCRISDYQVLNMHNVSVTPQGIPYVHYLPIKTVSHQKDNKEVETPLMRFALDIIKQTQFHFAILRYPTGKSGYNVKIRELLRYCGIDRECAVFNPQKRCNEYKPLWQLASSKLARKTLVDMLTKVQVNQYAAGLHKDGSPAISHYTKLQLPERFILMCAAFNQPIYKVDKQLNVIE